MTLMEFFRTVLTPATAAEIIAMGAFMIALMVWMAIFAGA